MELTGYHHLNHASYWQGKLTLWIHALRCLFHLSCFMTGIIYSFIQPLFLNADIWIFVYSLSGFILALDVVILIIAKRINHWFLIYALDSLFVALIFYKTGQGLFSFLYFIWLIQVVFASLQFGFRGALLQWIWISFLMTWSILLSPMSHYFDTGMFVANNIILMVLALVSGWTCRYLDIPSILSYLRSEIIKILDLPTPQPAASGASVLIEDFNTSLMRIKDIVRSRQKDENWISNLNTEISYLDQILGSPEGNFKSQEESKTHKKLLVKVSKIIKEAMSDVQSHKLPMNIESDLKSYRSVFGEASLLRKAIYKFMYCCGVYFSSVKQSSSHTSSEKLSLWSKALGFLNWNQATNVHISSYDDKDWIVVQMKWSNYQNKSVPFDLFFKKYDQGDNQTTRDDDEFKIETFFFKKVIKEHEGRIYTKKENFSWILTILFPAHLNKNDIHSPSNQEAG